ncbi:hypothetical protein [Pseudobutyrivibrio xylanivorans]|uniref:DUF5648 domain-containing protein n=1 Tax=Pseudobutyrivibrio xylanivorans TaxID=185007 RepID=A0A5P6VP70_PSEXY|nr:hypothetical protein [Pseudobutyrivibrio xylanivorans]QFJ54465.1 hypothetical protein FXF36_06125 [Pseudobutyrivibrio xylanivorans]
MLSPGFKVGKALEMNLWKNTTVWDALGNKDTSQSKSENIGEKNNTVLQIALELSDLVTKGLEAFRFHGTKAEALTTLNEKATDPIQYKDNTYFFDKLTNYLFVYASGFSSYVLAIIDEDYVPPVSGGSSDNKDAKTVPVYRLYNTLTGEHLYTIDVVERASLLKNETASGWIDEGIAWYVSDKAGKPVYRLLDMTGGSEHIYTTDANLRSEYVLKGWRDEGICWYAPVVAGREVFKLQDKNGRVFYTISEAEKKACEEIGCVAEQNEFTAY